MNINTQSQALANNGGAPIRIRSWSDNFTTGSEEKEAALRVLDSGYLSLFEGSHTPDHPFSFHGGPEVQLLEREWCEFYGCGHAVSMNSATSGLYAAIGALEIGYGDEVIVSPFTMTACAMAPLIYGAIPVFADIQIETGCLDPSSVERCITPRTKAIIIIHQFGFPADMNRIREICKKHEVRIIEDCAQAHGAVYKGENVGTLGDIGVFSLNVNKTIQSGEGGICTTHDPELAYRLKLIRNHGEAVVGPAGYERITNIAGFNYRMSELTAAIAREQLKKLTKLNALRFELVNYLKEGLLQFDCLDALEGPASYKDPDNTSDGLTRSTYYIFPLRFREDSAGIDRSEFVRLLKAEGVIFSEGYTKPLYFQPVYQQRHLFKHGYPFKADANKSTYQHYESGTCPNAEQMYASALITSEHIRPPHTIADMDDIINAIRKLHASS